MNFFDGSRTSTIEILWKPYLINISISPPRNLSNQTRQCFDGSTRYGLSEDQLQALLGRAGAEANGLVFTVRVAQWKGGGDSKHWQQTFAASWKIWVRSTFPVCWYNNLRSWKENCRSRWANFPLKQMLPELLFLEPSMRWGYHHVRVMHSPDTEVNAAVFALQVLFGGVAWLGVGSATKTSSRCRGTTNTRTRQFQPASVSVDRPLFEKEQIEIETHKDFLSKILSKTEARWVSVWICFCWFLASTGYCRWKAWVCIWTKKAPRLTTCSLGKKKTPESDGSGRGTWIFAKQKISVQSNEWIFQVNTFRWSFHQIQLRNPIDSWLPAPLSLSRAAMFLERTLEPGRATAESVKRFVWGF